MTRICTQCFCEKPLTGFRLIKSGQKSGKYHSHCVMCNRAYAKNWYYTNTTRSQAKAKAWVVENRERVRATARICYQRNKNINKTQKQAYAKHYIRAKRASNINFRVRGALCSRMNAALRGRVKKSASTEALLGCTIETFRQYLATLFQDGMTWKNYGIGHGKWTIDHIKPCMAFPDLATDPEQQAQCFHYTNLQPLWFEKNISKGANYNGMSYKKNTLAIRAITPRESE